MSKSNPARGMRDILPKGKLQRDRILSVILETFENFGFARIETPMLEPIANLQGDLGGDNEKMTFKVLRRGLEDPLPSGEALNDIVDMGLRYDLTLPLARFYAANHADLPPVFKVLQTGAVWRAERPQKGRYRQFTQCDIDIIGDQSMLAEAELISVTLEAFSRLGLEDLTLKINDRRLLHALLMSASVSEELGGRALITIDKLDKIGIEGVSNELSSYLTSDCCRTTRRFARTLHRGRLARGLPKLDIGRQHRKRGTRSTPGHGGCDVSTFKPWRECRI